MVKPRRQPKQTANAQLFAASCPPPSSSSGPTPSSSDRNKVSEPAVVDDVMNDNTGDDNRPQSSVDSPQKEDVIKEIKAKYVEAKKEYDQYVNTAGYDAFARALDYDAAATLSNQFFVDVPDYVIEEPEPGDKVAEFSGPDNVVSKLRVQFFDECPDPPKMTYWINTNINIVGKDQLYLNNFPYLGDYFDDEDKLTAELVQLFPEGVHGAKVGWKKLMNDRLLFRVCDPILKKHDWKTVNEIERLMIPFHELFPNKGSASQLASSFPDLIRKFDPDNAQPIGNSVYDKDGRIASHLPVEVIQDSNSSLICKRCYAVDCQYHPRDLTENDAHVERNDESIPDIGVACGNGCYRTSEARVNAEWTGEEKSYIDLLLNANIDNSCRIAQFLSVSCKDCSKTCKQVYEYISAKEPLPRVSLDPNRIDGNNRTLPVVTKKVRVAFKRDLNGEFSNARPYQACHHLGNCSVENGCSCKEDHRSCTKFCACPSTCPSKFPGCNCLPGQCNTHHCECHKASWECDPDLCKKCNCDGDENDERQLCSNVNIQRGLMRKLFTYPSTIAGTGCFTEDDIPKGAFVVEYCGELISQDEAERRGKVYDAYKVSYTFDLNNEQVIDATRIGNIARFINHSEKNANCVPKILIVNGGHKVGFFALRDIQAGSELFFDYKYNNYKKSCFNFVDE